MRRTLALVGLALLGWSLCGATIGVARAFMSMDAALLVHAAAAPLVAGSLAYLYARYLASTTPPVVGAVFLGVAVVLDAGLVAPFLEGSWDMFRSPIGTRIPFALILLGAWGAALWAMGPGPSWRWHATREERLRELPGDALLPKASDVKTHAVTIEASRERVWPWLVQMGCDRAGWYSWDRLDNGGRPSADRILPEFQHTMIGDVLPSRPGRDDGFLVLELEPLEHLALGVYFRYPGPRGLDWTDPPPRAFTRAAWTFVLETLPQERTRLLVRTRGTTRPWWLDAPMRIVVGPLHAVMQRKQLLNLKARAESLPV